MMLDKEIYSYLNTLDNLKALLKAKQRGISTDGQKNWCYKDGSNQLHVGADQKYWNGSAWVYASNEFGTTTLVSDSVGPVLTLGIDEITGYGDAPVIRAVGHSKNHLFIQRETDTPGIYDTWMEFSNNRIIIPKTLEIGDKYDPSGDYTDAKLIAWSNNNFDTLAIRLSPYFPTGLYMGITTADSQPDCPVIRASEYNGSHLHIQNTDGDTYIEFETFDGVKTVTVPDKLVVDGEITASAINAKYLGSATYGLYIKSDTGNIAAFWEYEGSRSLTVYGDLVVDSNLNVGGLTASQIVETDANKKLISVAKGTAYNANFGTGSNNVCRGNDSRLSDARTPINNDYYVQGDNSHKSTHMADADLNTYTASGFYHTGGSAANRPDSNWDTLLSHISSSTGRFEGQIAIVPTATEGKIFFRKSFESVWSSWSELYHSGKNLALGANLINYDGAADKGIGVEATGIPTVTATAYPSGDTRTVLRLYDDTAFNEGDGAGINLYGKTADSGAYANFGGIKVSKENGVSGNNSASFYIQSKKHGSNPENALRLDSSQNGYIKNKLMVGSLTETPESQLVVKGEIQCDTLHLDQTPIAGSITPDSYITIKCNGTNYKIPVKAV